MFESNLNDWQRFSRSKRRFPPCYIFLPWIKSNIPLLAIVVCVRPGERGRDLDMPHTVHIYFFLQISAVFPYLKLVRATSLSQWSSFVYYKEKEEMKDKCALC